MGRTLSRPLRVSGKLKSNFPQLYKNGIEGISNFPFTEALSGRDKVRPALNEHLSLCDEWIKIPLMGKIESSGEAYKRYAVIVGGCKSCYKVGCSGTAGYQTYADFNTK